MNPKTTIILVVALLIAVVGIWWAQSSSTEVERPEAAGPKRLLEPPLGELTGFEIKMGAEPALVFANRENKWEMTAPVAWPSETVTVDGDAKKVADLKYVKTYGKDDPDPPTDDMTSLKSPPMIVKLTDTAGKSYVVKIGARQALSKKTYVQKEGDEAIYLVDADLNSDLRRTMTDYRGKQVAEFPQSDAVRIEVSGEEQYTLVRAEGKWTVEEPVKGRADTTQINNLLRSLSGLRAQKFVEDKPAGLRPYGLEPARLKVAVTTETKTPKPPPPPPASAPAEPEFETTTKVVRLAFGGTANEVVFAKIDEEDKQSVFQVQESEIKKIAPPLSDLRDKRIAAVDTNRIQRLAVTAGGETIELNKVQGNWSITSGPFAGQIAEFAAVDDLLKAVRELKAIGFEFNELPAQGFGSPRAAIQLTSEGQIEPAQLTIGAATPSKTGAYVRNDREGFIAVVGAASADSLVVSPRTFLSRDLLKFPRNLAAKLQIERLGQPIELVSEGAAAATWQFVAPVTGPAEQVAVNNVINDLSNLRGRRVVGLAADAAKFGLDKPSAKVTVTVNPPPKPKPAPTTQPVSQPSTAPATESGDAATQPADATSAVTTQPAATPAEPPQPEEPPPPPTLHTVLLSRYEGKVYAMMQVGGTICEVDAKILDDLEAELLDTKVASIAPTSVTKVSLTGKAQFSFEKAGQDWQLQGEPSFQSDPAKITNLLNALRDLKVKRYVRYGGASLPEFGLDKPESSVRIMTDVGAEMELLVSATGPDAGTRYATSSSTPGRVFTISTDDAAKFTKPVQEYQKNDTSGPPPRPGPGPPGMGG